MDDLDRELEDLGIDPQMFENAAEKQRVIDMAFGFNADCHVEFEREMGVPDAP